MSDSNVLNIILLFDIESLIHSTRNDSYFGTFLQYTKELLWENQELDYNAIINTYITTLSTMSILTANFSDYTPDLSVIASHKAASRIAIALYWPNSKNYNVRIEKCIRSKLSRLGAPDNFIFSFHDNGTREDSINHCLVKLVWPYNKTSLIDFQNGKRINIPRTITLKE